MEGWEYIDTSVLFTDPTCYCITSLPLLLLNHKNLLGPITGCMLGDGYIQFKKKSEKANARYIITMKTSSKRIYNYTNTNCVSSLSM